MPIAKTTAKRRPGRPRTRPVETRRNVTFRVTEETYEQITAAAEAAGRSISEEIETRMTHSFAEATQLESRLGSVENVRLAMALGDAISLVETVSRRKWIDDAGTLEMVRDAVSRVMELARASQPAAPLPGHSGSKAKILLSVGARYPVAKLAADIAVMMARGTEPKRVEAVVDAMIGAANQALLPGRVEAGLADAPEAAGADEAAEHTPPEKAA